MLSEEEKALELRTKNLVLKQKEYLLKEKQMEQKQKQRQLFVLYLNNIVGSLPFILILFFISFSLGGALFINVPEGVGCDRDNTLCQRLRLRTPKVIYK